MSESDAEQQRLREARLREIRRTANTTDVLFLLSHIDHLTAEVEELKDLLDSTEEAVKRHWQQHRNFQAQLANVRAVVDAAIEVVNESINPSVTAHPDYVLPKYLVRLKDAVLALESMPLGEEKSDGK